MVIATGRSEGDIVIGGVGGTRGNRNGGLLGWKAAGWCGDRDLVTVGGIGLGVARGEAVGRDRITRSGQDSIGRVAADWETGADDAGNSKCCSRSYKLGEIRPEACTVAWGKSINVVVE